MYNDKDVIQFVTSVGGTKKKSECLQDRSRRFFLWPSTHRSDVLTTVLWGDSWQATCSYNVELLHCYMLHVTSSFAGIQTGEDGVISTPFKAFLTISTNDDPNGLFKFAEGSVDIPEDFKPGMAATTTKNLTVLRNQGSWGTVRVRWNTFS